MMEVPLLFCGYLNFLITVCRWKEVCMPNTGSIRPYVSTEHRLLVFRTTSYLYIIWPFWRHVDTVLTWYLTWRGGTSVESMYVASRPVQTSSSQQPMDLAE